MVTWRTNQPPHWCQHMEVLASFPGPFEFSSGPGDGANGGLYRLIGSFLGVGLSNHFRWVSADPLMMQRVFRLDFTATILFVCCLLCCTGDGEGSRRRVSVVRRGPWQHEVAEGVHPEAAITATFTNQINKNGSVVKIHLSFHCKQVHFHYKFIRNM